MKKKLLLWPRHEYTRRLLSATKEKFIWFETSPATLQQKIKKNLCDECWQANCAIDMCDGAIGAILRSAPESINRLNLLKFN
jgi:hypothetical protein